MGGVSRKVVVVVVVVIEGVSFCVRMGAKSYDECWEWLEMRIERGEGDFCLLHCDYLFQFCFMNTHTLTSNSHLPPTSSPTPPKHTHTHETLTAPPPNTPPTPPRKNHPKGRIERSRERRPLISHSGSREGFSIRSALITAPPTLHSLSLPLPTSLLENSPRHHHHHRHGHRHRHRLARPTRPGQHSARAARSVASSVRRDRSD